MPYLRFCTQRNIIQEAALEMCLCNTANSYEIMMKPTRKVGHPNSHDNFDTVMPVWSVHHIYH